MIPKTITVLFAGAGLIVSMGAVIVLAGEPAPKPAIASHADAERQLLAAKAAIMAADYHADLGALAQWHERVASLEGDPSWGYLAHYWAGYASWRLAINGVSHAMKGADLKANLERADADFDASLGARSDFADAYAAGASVNGWLGSFYRTDHDALVAHAKKSRQLLDRAMQLEPTNPRVLWVVGGNYLFNPPQYGGDPPRALVVYHQMLEVGDATSGAPSPLPDWGRPEAWMSLAYAHLGQEPPDVAAAEKEAAEALRLQPEWSYVRDVLMPQIAAKKAELAAPQPSPTPAPAQR